MSYPTRKNLVVAISPTPYADPLLMDMVPADALFFLGVDVATSNPGGVALVGKGGAGGPYTFTTLAGAAVTAGFEPAPGVTLNPDGTITGTPAAQGVYNFVAQVADVGSNTHDASFSINVQSGLTPVVFQPTIGEKSVVYRFAFIVRDLTGTTVPSGYTVSVGTLPNGLSLSSAGVVSGTPTALAVGVTQVTINVTYLGMSLDIPCTFTIADAMTVSFAQDRDPPNGWGGGAGSWLPTMIRGIEYVADIQIAGGVPPYSLTASSLPTGINLRPQDLQIRGKTMDPPTTIPFTADTLVVIVTDALGATQNCIRAFFILDSQQGRVQPQKNGVDVSGGDGPLIWNFIEGANVTITTSNDGVNFDIQIDASASAVSPANPTASVGLSVVNGVASTYMRSDAAPPLDQGITPTWTGAHDFENAISLSGAGVISPSALASGNTDDWNPTGLAAASVIRITPNAAGSTLRGITAPSSSRLLYLLNLGSGVLTLSNQSIGSSAANRLILGATSVALNSGQGIRLWYDTSTSRWRILSASNSTSGFQSAIQIQDEGVNKGAAGDATTWNFTGAGVIAAVSGSTGTVTIPGGGASAGVFYFGDGSDGAVVLDGTNTYPAFATKVGSVYTLIADMYCSTLQITSGAQLVVNGGNAGYKIICYTGILDCSGGATPPIFVNGSAGGAASGGTRGLAGTSGGVNGTLGFGGAGGNGASGGAGAGANGSAGSPGGATASQNGGRGAPPAGVAASGGTGSGGAGGTMSGAPALSPTKWRNADPYMFTIRASSGGAPTFSSMGGGGGGSGGGAGGGNGTQSGAGGGGGGGGNVFYIAARDIFCGTYRLVGCDGGAGGAGATPGVTNAGGGGGGSGGGGGYGHLVYQTLSGSGNLTLTAAGGAGGNAGNGTGTGTAGKGGTGGDGGTIVGFNLTTGVATTTTPTTGSANTGTTGGAGGTSTLTLTP